MTRFEMWSYLKLVDTSTSGARYDVTPVFGDFRAFSSLLDDFLELTRDIDFDTVVAIDALGFILGTGIAVRAEKPLVPIRKGGKLPTAVYRVELVDYTGEEKSLEIRADALDPSDRVLIVDEWVETGAQVRAAVELVERRGATVAAIVAINVDKSEEVEHLRDNYVMLSITRDL